MNRSVWGAVLCVLWLGCGVEGSGPEAATPRRDAVTRGSYFTTTIAPMPALPALVDLDRTPLSRFYPAGVTSAFTVMYRDASDEQRFYAIGFDVMGGRAYFYVTGATASSLARTTEALVQETRVIGATSVGEKSGVGFTDTDTPRPQPTPGIHTPEKAWTLASIICGM